MDGDGGVAEDRLGPGGRDGDRPVRVGIGLAGRLVDEVVADEPQRPGLGRRDDLEVAHAGPAARAPVDERLGPIGQAVAIQPLERDADGLGRALVHRVAQPTPVGRRADPPLLAEHHRPRRLRERDHPLEIALAAERLAALALLGEDAVEDELGGDARRGRAPAGTASAWPRIRAWRIIRSSTVVRWAWPRCSEPGHVGRRLDDRERRQVRVGGRARAVGREDVRGEPALVDRAFDLARRVGLRQLRRSIGSSSVWLRETERPLVQRTNGVVVPPAGSVLGAGALIAAGLVPAPSRRAIGRQPSRLASDVHAGGPARLAPSRARFGPSRRYSSRSSP